MFGARFIDAQGDHDTVAADVHPIDQQYGQVESTKLVVSGTAASTRRVTVRTSVPAAGTRAPNRDLRPPNP